MALKGHLHMAVQMVRHPVHLCQKPGACACVGLFMTSLFRPSTSVFHQRHPVLVAVAFKKSWDQGVLALHFVGLQSRPGSSRPFAYPYEF